MLSGQKRWTCQGPDPRFTELSLFLGCVVHLRAFFKLLQVSKIFSSVFIEKHPRVSGPVKFKPVLFKSQPWFLLPPAPNLVRRPGFESWVSMAHSDVSHLSLISAWQVVGCDHNLDSSKQEDKCLQCGGDGTTCYPVTGTFDANDLSRGGGLQTFETRVCFLPLPSLSPALLSHPHGTERV